MKVSDEPLQKDILTAEEAAAYLGISRNMVYKLTYQERIPYFRIGSLKRFRRSDLLEWAALGGTGREEWPCEELHLIQGG